MAFRIEMGVDCERMAEPSSRTNDLIVLLEAGLLASEGSRIELNHAFEVRRFSKSREQ